MPSGPKVNTESHFQLTLVSPLQAPRSVAAEDLVCLPPEGASGGRQLKASFFLRVACVVDFFLVLRRGGRTSPSSIVARYLTEPDYRPTLTRPAMPQNGGAGGRQQAASAGLGGTRAFSVPVSIVQSVMQARP